MRTRRTTAAFAVVGGLCLSAQYARAQQPPDSITRRQQRAIDSLSAAMRAMQSQLDSLARAPSASAAAPAAAQPRTTGAYMNVSFVGLTDFGWSTEPNVPALQVGDHDPHVRGFTIPNAELALDGTVDPYFKGFANIVYKIDRLGETNVELEEMYLLSSSLPKNLQLKAGQYFVDFGRQNTQHPHAWAFADEPLVLNRMFGPDGLRSQGARLSWLAPTSWYSEAMVSVMNSAGGTTQSFRSEESTEIHGGRLLDREVRSAKDLMIVPRRHVGTLAALEPAELTELAALTRRAEMALAEAYQPQGLNVGMNLGRPAGAGVLDHLHVHLVPRWTGDTNFMSVVGNVRVLPEELPQTAARLRPIFLRLSAS